MTQEERIVVRLSSEDLIFLSELVFRGKYVSESEAVRDAVRTLIDSHFSQDEKDSLLLKNEQRKSLDISDFAAEGKEAQKVLENVIKRGLESERGEN